MFDTQMGLTGFYQLLQSKGCYAPVEICLDHLRGKTVAIDGDFVMYTALHGYTTGADVTPIELAAQITQWLGLAKSAGIQTIFVTTGGEPPMEKQTHCSVLRKRKRDHQQVSIDVMKDQLTSIVDDIGEEMHLRDKIYRLENTIRRITSDMSRSVMNILIDEGWNCMFAKSEADFMLVMLSEDHLCDYVATDDADIIVAGAEHVLRGFMRMLTDKMAVGRVFCRSDILACLHMTSEALLELGSLLACDYQPPITNVGPVTAFRMIQKYGSVRAFIHSDLFDMETKNKKRKFILPAGMTADAYIARSSRSVDIFRSRPDKHSSVPTEPRD